MMLITVIGGEEEEKANDKYRKLITLHTRSSLLSDIYATAGYSHGRATHTLLQSLLGRAPSPIPDLGALHRACVWENIVLKSALSSRGIDVTTSQDLFSTFLSATTQDRERERDGQAATPVSERSNATTHGVVPATGTTAANATTTNGATPVEAPSSTPSVTKKEDQPRDKNARGLKYIVTQIPSSLGPFFQCECFVMCHDLDWMLMYIGVSAIVRLFQTRRSTDTVQKQKIKEAASILADIVVKHLEQKPFSK